MTKVRSPLVLALITSGLSAAQAQQLTATAGSHAIVGDLSVAWSIGEPITTTGSGANAIATQGFHQPQIDFITVIVPIHSNADWQLFPNPTRGALQLYTSSPEADHADVLNALGQRVVTWSIHAMRGAWDVEALASGSYRLHIFDRYGAALQTLSFIVAQ